MAKFPSQNLMTYDTPNLTNDDLQDCGTLNIPKDLSILNRRGYASTTRKGVPLVFRTRFTLYSADRDGRRPALDTNDAGSTSSDTVAETIQQADFTTLLRVSGCQDNWVMRNAAIKFHQAREKMFRDTGVLKKDLGAYAHEIRYNYVTDGESFVDPVDGDGTAFTGGTWDATILAYSGDNAFSLKLVGSGDNEEADAFAGSALQIGHSYLLSRVNQQADTNLETEEGPAKFSVLQKMMAPLSGATASGHEDQVIEGARDDQDNPPYEVLDISASGDVDHDITEPVLLGQGMTSISTPVASFICDVPFGLAKIHARHSGGGDQNVVDPVFYTAEVLKISEMQG